MLNIEVKTEKIMDRFETMTKQIETLGKEEMPQGLTDWQVEDMRRKYPETAVDETAAPDVSATTMIYPRSRTYEQTHPHRGHRPVAVRKPALSSMPRLRTSLMRHPILRPELFDKLYSRMVALLSEKLKWR
jgi:hypothetical protein